MESPQNVIGSAMESDAGSGSMMRAVVQGEYGSPREVLSLAEIERPMPEDDEVLIRVHAAGVDPGVWHLTAGLPYMVRVMGYGLRTPKSRVPGMDLAGRVEAVGSDVTGLQPGDEVFGAGRGSFAQYAVAKVDNLAPIPAGLGFAQAAVLAVSGITALESLRDVGRIEAGQKVLVIGAGGGVGSFAVQIAKAYGAEVTGLCSTGKVELVRSIGADHVIDYTKEGFPGKGVDFDLILDAGGRRPLGILRRALAPSGTLALVGGEWGGRWTGGFGRHLRAVMLSPFVGQRLRAVMARERREDLLVLKSLVETGKITPVIDRTFELSEAAEAVHYVEDGLARGKVAITV
jgi:NADPH:quinone reductase-like Zn-dependent oxidoreductase